MDVHSAIPGTAVPREPPYNLEAEQALLGAILVDNRALERVAEFLLGDHFADPVNGRIYDACRRLVELGHTATPVTLKGLFDQDDALAEVGGAEYLARLAASVVTVINAEYYGREIHDCYLRRELVDVGEVIVNAAHQRDLERPAASQIEAAEARLFALAEAGRPEGGFTEFGSALAASVAQAEAARRREGGLAGLATGLTALDELLGGLHPSDLLVLAARPAMGKTSLATNIAFNIASSSLKREGKGAQTVAFFSLEMSTGQLATRILADRAGISSERLRRGQLDEADFQDLVQASSTLERLPLRIDDTPAISMSALRTRARRLKRQHGLALIVVDYLQLMRAAGGARPENRVQEISAISQGLKAIAKELDVPVLALSQLSRAVENREDKRPVLADLRESGSIEQDADVVMFIYREEYYLQKSEPVRRADEAIERFHERHEAWQQRCEQAYGRAEVIVSKQRHGPTGSVALGFDGATTRFSDLADESPAAI